MNFETLTTKYIPQNMLMKEPFYNLDTGLDQEYCKKNLNAFIDALKTRNNDIYKLMMNQFENKTTTRNDLEKAMKAMETRLKYLDNPDYYQYLKPTFSLKKFSSSEIKERTKLHNEAAKVFAKRLADYDTKSKLVDVIIGKKNLDRSVRTILVHGTKNLEETAKYTQMLMNLDEIDKESGLPNKVVLGAFCSKVIKDTMNAVDRNATIPSEDAFLKNGDDFRYLMICADMDGNKIDLFKSVEHINLDKNIVKDWKEKYNQQAMSVMNLKAKMGLMANPLYKDVDPIDAVMLGDHINYLEQVTQAGLFVNENGNIVEKPDAEVDSNYVKNDPKILNINYSTTSEKISNLGEIRSVGGVLQSFESMEHFKTADGVKIEPTIARDNLNANLNFVFSRLDPVKNKMSDYQYVDNKGNSFTVDQVKDLLTHGQKFNVLDNGKYVFELSVDTRTSYSMLSSKIDFKPFDLKSQVDKEMDKNYDVFKEYSNKKAALELDPENKYLKKTLAGLKKNFDKSKKDLDKNLLKQVQEQAKKYYKDVKQNNPWYIKNKGNKNYTRVQDALEKASKAKTLEDARKFMAVAGSFAEKYIADKVPQGFKDNENSLKRLEAMKAIQGNLANVNAIFDDYNKSYANFDINKGYDAFMEQKQKEADEINSYIDNVAQEYNIEVTEKNKEMLKQSNLEMYDIYTVNAPANEKEPIVIEELEDNNVISTSVKKEDEKVNEKVEEKVEENEEIQQDEISLE